MMDSWLIFQRHLGLSYQEPRRECEPPVESGGQYRRNAELDVEATAEADSLISRWREKPDRVRHGARTVIRHRWVR